MARLLYSGIKTVETVIVCITFSAEVEVSLRDKGITCVCTVYCLQCLVVVRLSCPPPPPPHSFPPYLPRPLQSKVCVRSIKIFLEGGGVDIDRCINCNMVCVCVFCCVTHSRALVLAERGDASQGGHLPHSHALVGRARGQEVAVGREATAPHRARVPAQRS